MTELQEQFQDIIERIKAYDIQVKFYPSLVSNDEDLDFVIVGQKQGNAFINIDSILINENGNIERTAFNLGVAMGQYDRYKDDMASN